MFNRYATIPSCSTLLLAVCAAHAGAPTVTYEQIPGAIEANDMSPDGRWIVGTTGVIGNPFPTGAYRWDTVNDVMTIIPDTFDVRAVSNDGSVVLGNIVDPASGNSTIAGIWTDATGWTGLGALPTAGFCPDRSTGYELSGDGTVATGLSWQNGCQAHGFRWTQATGMVPLELLANGSNRASVISDDGSVMAGFAQGSQNRTPAFWDNAGDGTLIDPPNGDAIGEIHGLRDDGSVLLGEYDADAIRWTPGGGVEVVAQGQLIPGWIGIAMDIADDETVVGFDILFTSRRAWIQPQGTGSMRELGSWITGLGGTLPPGTSLEVCQAISADGTSIIGHGFGTGAWRVLIDNGTCDGDLNGDDSVGFADLNQVLTAWGPCAGCPEDLDGDGNVGFSDLNTVLTAWGPCP